MEEQAIEAADRERQNLFRAVQFGLELPQAWEMTAEIALSAIPLINRRLYRQEWIPVLEHLVVKCPAAHQRAKFDLLIQLGRMQRLEQQRDSAVETLQQAEALARQIGDPQALARAYYNLGRVHLDARRYTDAERHSRRALDILNEQEVVDQALIAWVLNTLGKVSQVDGEYDAAYEYYSRSVAIWRTIGDETGLLRALMDLATNFRYSGQLDEAIALYKQADELVSSTTNELDKALVGINLGATYYDKKELSLAEETFRKAYSPYLRKAGDLRMRAILTANLGNVMLEVERLAEAEAFLCQAIDLWEQQDDDLNMANSLGTLGEVLARRGDSEVAILLFDEALTLSGKFPTHPLAIQMQKIFEAEKRKAENVLRA
jgi:tetratricopeptide (TPR) repeat protein